MLLAVLCACQMDYASLRGKDGGAGSAGHSGEAGSTPNIGAGGGAGVAGSGGSVGVSGIAGVEGTAGTVAQAGQTGAAGTEGTIGGAGTSGTAGTKGAGGSSASAGSGGGAGVTGSGTGGMAGATGAAGQTGGGCNRANWTFIPNNICVNPPNPSCGFQATAREPKNAIDGDPTTRYTSGKTQSGDENFVLSFGSRVRITGINVVTTDMTDYARAYRLEYAAADETTFVAFNPIVAGTGAVNLAITFPATTMMALKFFQTGMVAAPSTSWWGIHEITVTGCVPQ
jgi:hypothetical protein